jgi:DNA-directed RNA polymerase specialized sigma24 family protein
MERLRPSAGAVFSRADRSFDELLHRYSPAVGLLSLRLTGDREVAAELAERVFAEARSRLPSFEPGSRLSTWLYSIAREEFLAFLEARPVRGEDARDGERPGPSSRAGDPA